MKNSSILVVSLFILGGAVGCAANVEGETVSDTLTQGAEPNDCRAEQDAYDAQRQLCDALEDNRMLCSLTLRGELCKAEQELCSLGYAAVRKAVEERDACRAALARGERKECNAEEQKVCDALDAQEAACDPLSQCHDEADTHYEEVCKAEIEALKQCEADLETAVDALMECQSTPSNPSSAKGVIAAQ